VLLALDAVIIVQSVRGERRIPAAEYFLGYRQTQLAADELVRCVQISLYQPEQTSLRLTESYKVGKRGSDDISIVAACFVLDLDQDHVIVRARLAYGGIAAVPIRAVAAEAALLGQTFNLHLRR
jgi:xanthine dehydrogenase small subunit